MGMEKEVIISKSEMNNKFHDMKVAYSKLLANDFQWLEATYKQNHEALFNPITVCGDTMFHVAAYRGSEAMLQTLVELVPQTKRREVLKMKNVYGNTVLHELVTTAKAEAADLLMKEVLFSDGLNREDYIREREEILEDRNKLGETPLFRAVEYGNMSMVKYLATQIEGMGGNLHRHYTRDHDGLSILHIAVIGQHFDTANWLVERYPELATYKDNNGKTALHLLASMATSFKSSSFLSGLFEEFIYYCIPGEACNGDEGDELPIALQNKDLEQGEPSKAPNQPGNSKGLKWYYGVLRCLKSGWKVIDRVWGQKQLHTSAIKLARHLVRTDTSWFQPHQSEEDDTICLERNYDKEEEKVKEIAAAGKEKSSEPDTPLFIAASTGIVEIVKEILDKYPQAIKHINKSGQNILHVATLHRTYKVYDLVVKNKEEKNRLVRGIDNNGCTILHHAADIVYYHGGTKPTPALKLQQELEWFETVKNEIPGHFTLHRNKDNMTADQLFNDRHKDQLQDAQEWVKNTSESCSTVAVLVAGVVFAAAYSAPGGFHDNGQPILLERPLYSFFTVMDVAGLASSLTSVVIFLSILTSSLEYKDFGNTIPRNLSLGFTFLFFSVTTTMLTFTATILLLVHLEKKWTASLTYAAAFLPICIFALFQFPLYYQYFIAAVKGIFNFIRKNMPGNWEFLRIKGDF
ncbi:hypothetical protein ERO13_D06G158100v2 [Gossypium hirsutum]|uniref:PGG domain-containing protein n=3 Tax=Gossypium TaxID=3633 RepID=A0A1U8JYC0_GOSHI|nr:uncharacterized protein LOC107910059 [Gossypium hirsutum]KAG4142934.1 hypothetical protein ERO13_D06G158100v2 [Gossypium hirsutum]TYH67629.1 hypothetical protein ES332_D06G201800v1 [Gossypium tomentosum]TYI78090.1 hypothetical protein E1A91_D06G187300v1 [Gossypium mustelinum]